MDVGLLITHSTKLIFRGITWKITNAGIYFVIIGVPVLKLLRCDEKALIAAACDQNDGIINVSDALKKTEATRYRNETGKFASLF